jgi:hypothetical protein
VKYPSTVDIGFRRHAADPSVAAAPHRAATQVESTGDVCLREPTSAMAVNEPGLDSSADGKGEEGIDRSLERTATPIDLGQ